MKLNLGAGGFDLPGYLNLDRERGDEAFPLNFPAGSADEIRASHLLEHFSHRQALAVLEAWTHVLAPGGWLKIAVPDFDWICRERLNGKPVRELEGYVCGGQYTPDDFHGSIWTEEKLRAYLEAVGLTNLRRWQSEITDCANYDCSLNLEGQKPMGVAAAADIKIAAVISIPRVGWNDHWGAVLEALRPFGIPVRRHSGAYWEQGMGVLLEECVRDGLDWVLTLDYDTLFTAKQLDQMLGWFGERPEIDALAALQCRRGGGYPLVTKAGQTSVAIDGQPLQVNTAHFGCTLIRVDSLTEVPLPWFKSLPAPDGSWLNPDHLDADIWFWKQWERAGKTVYLAPDVRVGHLEVMVAEFDEHLQPRHRHVNEWWQTERSR